MRARDLIDQLARRRIGPRLDVREAFELGVLPTITFRERGALDPLFSPGRRGPSFSMFWSKPSISSSAATSTDIRR